MGSVSQNPEKTYEFVFGRIEKSRTNSSLGLPGVSPTNTQPPAREITDRQFKMGYPFAVDSGQVVPKKGLEPPHPCGYMDLNHARLPIPPLRQSDWAATPRGSPVEEELRVIFYKGMAECQTRRALTSKSVA
jgi:hypothetical protein